MRPWFLITLPCSALLATAACAGSQGGFSTAPTAALPAPLEDAVSRPHRITLGGVAIPYTATAGHLTAARLEGGAPEAAFFYVAYTADGMAPATRPVTFCYNGGPGSASVWLHLGSFGPKRLVTGDPATTGSVPFPLVDNPECLLDSTDLVFVDAVGTGLSEAVAPNTNQTFWGVDQDAAVFRDFVLRYLAANHRQASPFYLFGESYGTPRTAVLGNLLPGILIGRYDGRVNAPWDSPLSSDGDPSSTFIAQPFATAITSYLDDFLGYGHGSDYAVMGEANEDWDFTHDGLGEPDTIPDLLASITRDPSLKILSLNGYHDLATPFYQTELDLARMGRQPNLQIKHYNGGHMIYLDDTSRPLEKADLAAFYHGAPDWSDSADHAFAPPSYRPLVMPTRALPPWTIAPPMPRLGPLMDPYIPSSQRRPSAEPATTGAALRAQVTRKLGRPD
jgi:carboxypeptidase C (cathepsin A)